MVVEKGRVIDDPEERLHRAFRDRLTQADAISDRGAVAFAERRSHPLAYGDGRTQIVGHAVNESVVERPVENHVGV
jgi:hypothetical protein